MKYSTLFQLPILMAFTAGCVPSMPMDVSAPPLNVNYNARGAAIASRATYTGMEVRTFENVGAKRVWIEDRAGVPCTVKSAYYAVNLKTPAAVNMPVFGDETPPVEVTCVYEGETVSRTTGVFKMRDGSYGYAEQSLIFKR